MLLKEPEIKRLVNICLHGGADIIPIHLPNGRDTRWPGFCNPSILWDEKDQDFKFILRNVNYVLHANKYIDKNWTGWGPLYYANPDFDGKNLKTQNYIAASKDPFTNPFVFSLIKTAPYTPRWEFQGQEDARVVRWNDQLMTTGVRRDDNTTGQGRMEIMHLKDSGSNDAVEYSQGYTVRIQGPGKDDSYCEKNWMPITDIPYHYVQCTNPTRIYKVNSGGGIELVVEKPKINLPGHEYPLMEHDMLRGSSQCIPWNGGHVAIVHTCELWFTGNHRKVARYNHLFVFWDADWNIKATSPVFSFNDHPVEFTCGLAFHDGFFYIPFALQDNHTYLMKVPEPVIHNFIFNKDNMMDMFHHLDQATSLYQGADSTLFDPKATADGLYNMAVEYNKQGQLAKAYCILSYVLDRQQDLVWNVVSVYDARFVMARVLADLGRRDNMEISLWLQCINEDRSIPDGWLAAAMFYLYRGGYVEALFHAETAWKLYNEGNRSHFYNKQDIESAYESCRWETNEYTRSYPYFITHGINKDFDKKVF